MSSLILIDLIYANTPAINNFIETEWVDISKLIQRSIFSSNNKKNNAERTQKLSISELLTAS